jgi:hypothetical protein
MVFRKYQRFICQYCNYGWLQFTFTGGLCGFFAGTIENCHAIVDITGGMEVGGLCGLYGGDTINCYTAGTVCGNFAIGSFYGTIKEGSINGVLRHALL